MGIADYSTVRTQALGEVYADGVTVMIGMDKRNNHRKGADNPQLNDDLHLYLPETVCWLRTGVSVQVNYTPCHWGGNARCANVVKECQCAGKDSGAQADLLEQGSTIRVRVAC